MRSVATALVVAAMASVAAAPAQAESGGPPALLPLPRGVAASSYFAQQTRRVEAAILRFAASLPVEEQANRIEFYRERDRLRLWHPSGVIEPPSAAIGSTLFAAAVIFAAHAPTAMRAIVDTSALHLGPSISDTGGVGIAIGGHF